MKNIFTLIFLLISYMSFGQTDSVAITKFLQKQQLQEQRFIDLLKNNKIDSCLKFFSPELINKYGKDSLITDLQKLNNFFSKYPAPEIRYSLSTAMMGVGAFGHDVNGNLELQSSYTFLTKKHKFIYYFDLFFTDQNPSVITYYRSKFLNPYKSPKTKLKKLKRSLRLNMPQQEGE